jgi:hypothetical protein|tara:strand:+ start:200 stop:499 length:300 start_codon:yes stop_codon:yes gene_type:complete
MAARMSIETRNGLTVHGYANRLKAANVKQNTAPIKPASDNRWPEKTSLEMFQNVLLSTLNTNAMERTVSSTGEMLIRSRRTASRDKRVFTEAIIELSQI